MSSVKVLENIFWVGAIDWNIRHFHGFSYSTHHGTTYNAYLIVDEKTALVDTVRYPFANEMIGRINEIINPSEIDYVITNHVEMDHSGAISEILTRAHQAKVIGTSQCKKGLRKHHFGNWNFEVVRTNDEIDLGEKTLKFIEAPMLHWPDSMFTYVVQDELMLSNDAFGQHLATSKRFDDEVDEKKLMGEAAKYYANILWPFSRLVEEKIEEVQKLDLRISTIAPSHGVIWRRDPERIIDAYLNWAKGETVRKILVVYDTMWGSTEKLAKAIVGGIISEDVETMLFRLPFSDIGDLIHELLEAKGVLVGSSTINRGVLPTLAPFLEEIQGLRPRNKIAAAFGSYGWGGGAIKTIEEKLRNGGIEIVSPAFTVNWVPDKNEIQRSFEFGKEFARKVKER